MRLVFSVAAEADLEEIGDFIARDNPGAARRLVVALRGRCDRLLEFPRAAVARDDLAPGLFMAAHGRYRIAYRILDGSLRIECVLHGARDLTRIDFDRGA